MQSSENEKRGVCTKGRVEREMGHMLYNFIFKIRMEEPPHGETPHPKDTL